MNGAVYTRADCAAIIINISPVIEFPIVRHAFLLY